MSCFAVDGLGLLVDFGDDGLDGLADAAHQAIGIGAGGHMAQAFLEDGLGQDGGGGGAVAGHVGGLAGGFLDQLGADVFVLVVELDFLGDGDAVLGDGRATPALVEHGIAAAGAERALHRRASFSTPCNRLRRASTSKANCFAPISIHLPKWWCGSFGAREAKAKGPGRSSSINPIRSVCVKMRVGPTGLANALDG